MCVCVCVRLHDTLSSPSPLPSHTPLHYKHILSISALAFWHAPNTHTHTISLSLYTHSERKERGREGGRESEREWKHLLGCKSTQTNSVCVWEDLNKWENYTVEPKRHPFTQRCSTPAGWRELMEHTFTAFFVYSRTTWTQLADLFFSLTCTLIKGFKW